MKTTRLLLFTLLLTLITVATYAQDEKPAGSAQSYLDLSFGVSNPLGDFASTNYYNYKSGLATKGITFAVSGAHYFSKHWGLAGSLALQDNGRPTPGGLQNLSDGYNADLNPTQTVVIVSERFQSLTAMIGPQYSFVRGKFTIDLGVSAGMLKSFDTPYYDTEIYTTVITTTSTTTLTDFYQNSSTDANFAYGANVGLRFNVSDNFGFSLSSHYIGSEGPAIFMSNYTYSKGRQVTRQPMNTVQSAFGIFFGF